MRSSRRWPSSGHHTDGNARHRANDGDAGIQESQRARADGGHGRAAVGFQDVANQSHDVGEDIRGWEHGFKGALRQCSVADFAATGSHDAFDFAGGERREVVSGGSWNFFGVFIAQAINNLFVLAGAQGGGGEDLGFTALKECRAVRAREQRDGAHEGGEWFWYRVCRQGSVCR